MIVTLGDAVVSVLGNWYNNKFWVSCRVYIYNFSCNILHLISFLVYIHGFYHSSTKIGNVRTSFHRFILNSKSMSRHTVNWVRLLLHCLRHIHDGRVCYIQRIPTFFITHKTPGKLSQLVIRWTERVCYAISYLHVKWNEHIISVKYQFSCRTSRVFDA